MPPEGRVALCVARYYEELSDALEEGARDALTEEQRLKIDPQARPLALDPELTRIARERASDMAAKSYLAHAAPNGDTSATLLMR